MRCLWSGHAESLDGGWLLTPARALDRSCVAQEIGRVLRRDRGCFVVSTAAGDIRCARAKSCLVAPALGDTVLVAAAATGRAWVLAVLDGTDDHTRIEVDGDLAVTVPDGAFTVASRAVGVLSGRLDVNALDGNVALQHLTYVGRFLRGEVEKIRVHAGNLDTVLERFSQRVKRSLRKVEELDQLHARQIDHRADKAMSMRAANALLTAETLVKVDAEQIHLG